MSPRVVGVGRVGSSGPVAAGSDFGVFQFWISGWAFLVWWLEGVLDFRVVQGVRLFGIVKGM